MAVSAPLKKAVASPLDGPSFAGLYKVASAPSLPATTSPTGRPGRPAGALTRAYRGQIGGLQGVLRWVNDSAYLLSVPFIALLIFGAVVHNHALAMLGATLVVLLNTGRLVTGVANLALIPFRQSPIQGILVLIPPITIFYCMANWKKMKKPVKRVIEPTLTLAAVLAAFAFIPWLNGKQPKGDLKSQLTAGVEALESDVRQQVGDLPQNLQRLPREAEELLQKGTETLQKQTEGQARKSEGAPPTSAAPASPPTPGPLDQPKGAADQLKAIREEKP
jgi:hypothetical protein